VAESVEEILDAIHELDGIRHKFAYQTDGAVVKVNSITIVSEFFRAFLPRLTHSSRLF
jgi:NAD-dependent DNA ligase